MADNQSGAGQHPHNNVVRAAPGRRKAPDAKACQETAPPAGRGGGGGGGGAIPLRGAAGRAHRRRPRGGRRPETRAGGRREARLEHGLAEGHEDLRVLGGLGDRGEREGKRDERHG